MPGYPADGQALPAAATSWWKVARENKRAMAGSFPQGSKKKEAPAVRVQGPPVSGGYVAFRPIVTT